MLKLTEAMRPTLVTSVALDEVLQDVNENTQPRFPAFTTSRRAHLHVQDRASRTAQGHGLAVAIDDPVAIDSEMGRLGHGEE